jgi:hypothetical protein
MTHCPGRDELERLLATPNDSADEGLERHVESCAACQQALESMARAEGWGTGLGDWPELRAIPAPRPDTFLRRLQQAPPWAIDRAAGRLGPAQGRGTESLSIRGPASDLEAARADEPAGRAAPHVAGYEILGELGRGGMGVVYQAKQLRLNRPCALKMILAGAHAHPELSARFLAEAQAIARLQHPHIVQIYHIGDADGLPFLELEYIEGGTWTAV